MYVSHEELLECIERNRLSSQVRKYANGQVMTHATIEEDYSAFCANGGAVQKVESTRQGDAPELRKQLADMDRGRVALAKKRRANSLVILPGSLTHPREAA